MSSVGSNPLNIAEMIAIVFDCLREHHSLVACAQVNKMWAEEATSRIWSYETLFWTSPFVALLATPNYRRQRCANRIRHVNDFYFGNWGDNSKLSFFHAQFASLKFP